MKVKSVALVVASMLVVFLAAHPHFSKTVTAEVEGRVLTLRFTTYPYSAAHLAEVKPGFTFHCGRANLKIEGSLGTAGKAIPPGEYMVRAVAKSVDSWALVLVPTVGGQESGPVVVSKAITLLSHTSTGLPSAHHLDLDLYSGHDETEGKLLLSVAFGERRVEGVFDLM